ncbi:MAG: hypothetical protein K8S25_09480 [Alphaproteobacteria bacterium]|nr:hypothetical protein [Alphaproteobacteria bacterium]
MTTTESVEEKKVNPSASYTHPKQVLVDAALSQDEKVAILREWHYDAVRLQDSAGENMTGGEPDLLQSVSNALLELGVSPAVEADPFPPAKQSVLRRLLNGRSPF